MTGNGSTFFGPTGAMWGDGNIQNNTFVSAPRPPATLPHQVGVVPLRARSFQHRAEADRLRSAVSAGETVVLCQLLVGMGGVGKTQLAADFAHQAWDEGTLELLVWITASSREDIVSGYARAGVEVCGADPRDREEAAGMFLAWLRAKRHQWLVVLDDLAEPDDLRGLWPPETPNGRTLVTTRSREPALLGTGRRRIEVGLFTPDEAVAYLSSALAVHGRTESRHDLAGLASDLGYLALALSQAAAYIADRKMGVTEYRDLLADRRRRLADALPRANRLPDDQTVTVTAVWSLSLDRADQQEPVGAARPLMQLLALGDPNGVPVAVLYGRSVERFYVAAMPDLVPVWGIVGRGLQVLHRLSLIQEINTAYGTVRVHALVQRATRESLPADQHHAYARAMGDALLALWPEIDGGDPLLALTLRANTANLIACADEALVQAAVHPLLSRYGRSLGEAGLEGVSRDHFQSIVALARRLRGSEDPDILTAQWELARWQGEAGDAAGAASTLRQLLADTARQNGPDHLNTLLVRSSLAHWQGKAGDPDGAVVGLAQVLDDFRRILHDTHPLTLDTRASLAHWRGETGDPDCAVTALAQVVRDRLTSQGWDHPGTLNNMGSLAEWQGRAGDPAAAVSCFAELLPVVERVLGTDHPYTLSVRGDLAHWRGEAGDPTGAAAALGQLLTEARRILGPNHPRTKVIHSRLAHWQQGPREPGLPE
ncbi:tetratricopeptide repeat protein [Actinacidiphila guanduensis]|uniref:Tetratricopeptide repeat-containing protein n=1 Tax=Actinacidiphila guanduensis TaxID=310781 RepID=A0A1G9UVB1_9ACTN|nr:tetratricopeptide repeat protein [Actinacidiphila guanduensis]SDM63858.1 Tetratricopeptide repeat-containing protein [Actinacidiphila guanduensis]